ncbi:unnamed protein product [Lactuca virosa]|uniref:Uncharacterized protein n=1 Tax=Lactuca virosa TaxID=75947 RepID=A0AAU9N8B6_9ASTR|nr:unnamed protein product [Lactuca virosa]
MIIDPFNSRRRQTQICFISIVIQVLDIMPGWTLFDLKAAFCAKVKQFHHDVIKSDDVNVKTLLMLRNVRHLTSLMSLFFCKGSMAARHAFTFSSSIRTAHATSQGHGEGYQLVVGHCLRNCIHFVTPSQRIILQELLDWILLCRLPHDPLQLLQYPMIYR